MASNICSAVAVAIIVTNLRSAVFFIPFRNQPQRIVFNACANGRNLGGEFLSDGSRIL